MQNIQEEIFKDIKKLTSNIDYLAGYVQNDIQYMLDHGDITTQQISDSIIELDNEFDNFRKDLADVHFRSREYLIRVIDSNGEFDDTIAKNLLRCQFLKDLDMLTDQKDKTFLENTQFFVQVTDKSYDRVSGMDKAALSTIEKNTRYAVHTMTIGNKNGWLTLRHAPNALFAMDGFEFERNTIKTN